jgi:hypothetical protein
VGADLLGREHELDEVSRLLGRLSTGSGGLLVFVGVPGVGKTALLDATATLAHQRRLELLRASPAVGQPGCLVWAQLLGDVGAPKEVAAALLQAPGPLDLDRAARALASRTPRVVLVDDFHLAGEDALGVLSVLAARAVLTPTAVVVASDVPLGMGREVRLGPLSEDELARVVGSVGGGTSRALWVASGGLPGPARELAAGVADLTDEQEALTFLALHAPSRAWFLGVDVNLIRLIETAVRGAGDDGTTARLLARLARELLGDASAMNRRRELADDALALARCSGDERVLAEVLDARLGALWDPAGAPDRLATATEIMELARSAGDGVRERHGLFWRFMALMELGRVAEGESTLAVFERFAQEAGDAEAAAMVTARRSMLALLRGRFDDARRLANEFIVDARRCRLPDADVVGWTLHGFILKETGDHSAATAAIERLVETARRSPGHFHEALIARILASIGRSAEASLELDRIMPSVLARPGPRWMSAMADLAFVAFQLDDAVNARRIYEALEPFRDQLVVVGGAVVTMEPVAHYLGLLSMVLGLPELAVAHIEEAIRLEEQIGALPFLAHSLDAHASALEARNGDGDAAAASAARQRARSIAERLGMTLMLESNAPTADEWQLVRDGEDWSLYAGDERVRLRDGRGIHYLRLLLAAPRREIAALDLVAGGAAPSTTDLGPVLDDSARRAYRLRLGDLDAELDAADRRGDRSRAERAETERQALLDELRRASGLGGRARRSSPESERARVNVTRTIRSTLARVAEHAPKAAAHLQASMRTGQMCRYEPVAGGPARWRL